jgi:hypothetical protein
MAFFRLADRNDAADAIWSAGAADGSEGGARRANPVRTAAGASGGAVQRNGGHRAAARPDDATEEEFRRF